MKSSCGSEGMATAGTDCEWRCLWEIQQKKAQGKSMN